MDLELKNKVVIVTGGASGIGEAIVRTLAIEGAIPVILDKKSPDDCETLLDELDIEAVDGAYLRVDLTDAEQVAQAVRTTILRYETIDGLVNNAGVNDAVGLDASPTAFRGSLEKNLISAFTITHFATPHLRANAPSAIVNIGSKVAVTGQGGTSGYAAAKGGLAALTREWALDLAASRVRVNAVMPAEVWTPMYDDWLSGQADPSGRRAEIEGRIPLGQRMTEAQEIADTVLFLLSPRSSHTTGQILHVDGGYVHFDRAYRP
ncbi:MAG: SDR family oxidoreductase [Verrucomicrobiales bacterium]|nr:SDR family oxidoreductase [Verrucomicrobiales bacterium]